MSLGTMENSRRRQMQQTLTSAAVALFMAIIALCEISFAAAAQQKTFASTADAVKAAITAAKNNDDKELLAIFGAQAKDLISSGDAVADKQRRAQFIKAFDEKNRLVVEGESTIVVIGKRRMAVSYSAGKEGRKLDFRHGKRPGRDSQPPHRRERVKRDSSRTGVVRCPARVCDEGQRRRWDS